MFYDEEDDDVERLTGMLDEHLIEIKDILTENLNEIKELIKRLSFLNNHILNRMDGGTSAPLVSKD